MMTKAVIFTTDQAAAMLDNEPVMGVSIIKACTSKAESSARTYIVKGDYTDRWEYQEPESRGDALVDYRLPDLMLALHNEWLDALLKIQPKTGAPGAEYEPDTLELRSIKACLLRIGAPKIRRDELTRWANFMGMESEPLGATGKPNPAPAKATPPNAQERQDKRWQMCIDAGLPMPRDTYAQYPRGIGKIATKLGITPQSLREDLNKYRERVFGKTNR